MRLFRPTDVDIDPESRSCVRNATPSLADKSERTIQRGRRIMSVWTAENDAEQPQKDLGEDLVGKAVDWDDRADVGKP